jgi:hypothetical protein
MRKKNIQSSVVYIIIYLPPWGRYNLSILETISFIHSVFHLWCGLSGKPADNGKESHEKDPNAKHKSAGKTPPVTKSNSTSGHSSGN